MTRFLRLTAIEERRQGEVTAPVVLQVSAMSSIIPLKVGGCRVELTNGTKHRLTIDYDTLLDIIGVEDFADADKVDNGPKPETDEDGKKGKLADEDDIKSICSPAALKLAEEAGIDVASVALNDKGRIGKPEVEAYIEGLKKGQGTENE